jgi:RHS repeat-associated protein
VDLQVQRHCRFGVDQRTYCRPFGWEGASQRPTDRTPNLTSLIQMGARPYAPQIGRFLAVDPVEGGATTNPYGYVNDPVNTKDLTGRDLSWTNPLGELLGRGCDSCGTPRAQEFVVDTTETSIAVGKMIGMRGISAAINWSAVGCGPAIAACKVATGGAASALYYRTCGTGVLTCRSGKSDRAGLARAAAQGATLGYFGGVGSIVRRVTRLPKVAMRRLTYRMRVE